MSGDQCCRPAESPAGLNGAENGKKKEGPVENLIQIPSISSPLPSWQLSSSLPTFSPSVSTPAPLLIFLCTERMFVSLHMLIKRKGQRGLNEKGSSSWAGGGEVTG